MVNLDIDNVFFLKCKKYIIQNALFCPAVGAHVDTVPAAKFLGQASPFAAVLRDIKQCVEYLQVRYFHVAARDWQQVFDNLVLLRCNFHRTIIHKLV